MADEIEDDDVVVEGDEEFGSCCSELREAMSGRDFNAYANSFETWFGVRPPAPKIGFPIEQR